MTATCFAPSLAHNNAIARPIPRPPPVTSTRWPSNAEAVACIRLRSSTRTTRAVERSYCAHGSEIRGHGSPRPPMSRLLPTTPRPLARSVDCQLAPRPSQITYAPRPSQTTYRTLGGIMERCNPASPHAGAWVARHRPYCHRARHAAAGTATPICKIRKNCGSDRQRSPRRIHGSYPLHTPLSDSPLAHIGGHACTCQGFVDGLEWRPSSCELPSFDPRKFCQLLNGRRMLFIGDSTVEQAASVLMNSVQMGYWGTGETSCATSISMWPTRTRSSI